MPKIKKIKYGVIPAAGPGKRMGYLSNLLPKCLFPLSDRPILHHVINQMEEVEIEKIFIIINYNKEKLIEYVNSIKEIIKPEIVFIEQEKMGGLGEAILITERYIQEPFVVILGDDCTIGNSLKDMIEFFFQKNPIALEGVIKEKNQKILKDTCCAKLNKESKIIEIIEKPSNPLYDMRGCGIYIFHPQIFEYLKKTSRDKIKNTLEITHAINKVAQEGLAYGYNLAGYNVNINTYNDLIRANLLLKKCQKS